MNRIRTATEPQPNRTRTGDRTATAVLGYFWTVLYNKQFINLTCSVCAVKYRTSLFLVLKNLSPIFHGTDLTLG